MIDINVITRYFFLTLHTRLWNLPPKLKWILYSQTTELLLHRTTVYVPRGAHKRAHFSRTMALANGTIVAIKHCSSIYL